MEIESLRELFIGQLQDIYNAEKQLTGALPRMANAAASKDLRSAFREHLIHTQTQIQRLHEIFHVLGASPQGRTCKGMEGLIAESDEVLDELDEPELQDVALITSAQRMEHYELSAYHTASAFARALGEEEVAALLEKTLSDEQATHEQLARLAEIRLDLDPGRANNRYAGS